MEKETIIKTLKDTLKYIKEEANKTQSNNAGWDRIISFYEKAIINAESNRFSIDDAIGLSDACRIYLEFCSNYTSDILKIMDATSSKVKEYFKDLEKKQEPNSNNRDILIKSMQLPNNIRSLSEEERNKIISETIIKVSKILKEIQCDSSEYKLSERQQRTKNNAINNIKSKEFLEAYYEITDFVDDYGDRHNGKIFVAEKQEINNLISIIYNNIKQ